MHGRVELGPGHQGGRQPVRPVAQPEPAEIAEGRAPPDGAADQAGGRRGLAQGALGASRRLGPRLGGDGRLCVDGGPLGSVGAGRAECCRAYRGNSPEAVLKKALGLKSHTCIIPGRKAKVQNSLSQQCRFCLPR